MEINLVLIHTVKPLISVFDHLAPQLIPRVKLFHILDEPLLERVRLRGRLAAEDAEHLATHVRMAEQINASAALVTCSTVSPCVDQVRQQAAIPVVKIDEAMIARAVAGGEQIGVIATNPTTIEPTRQMLEARALDQHKPIVVESVLVGQALPALFAGDTATHDTLVSAAIHQLSPQVDVIVLAQASTARVLETIPERERIVPILASPYLALEQVAKILKQGLTHKPQVKMT